MSKTSYRVADGVEWVNGSRVPPSRVVQLTDAEALYEKALGRIVDAARRRPAKKAPETAGDEA